MDGPDDRTEVKPFRTQLLKWVGNKKKFAHEIVSYFPQDFRTFYEPFIGAGSIMATLAPARAVGSDIFAPLIEIWQKLADDPEGLKAWYADRHAFFVAGDRIERYEAIKAAYNAAPNGADFLFLTRSCYGSVVRFRKKDGYTSTPCGAHDPIPVASFDKRVDIWHARMKGARFAAMDYREAMAQAGAGDLVYCDPPYAFSQTILYGSQSFRLDELFDAIAAAKGRGAKVALSIDGTKKSGGFYCDIKVPDGLFARERMVNVGVSMLKRFQMQGQTMEDEGVKDRLLLTW